MKRLFIAIKINPEPHFLEVYRALQKNLSHEKIKWVSETNFHLTLRFLGETGDNQCERIIHVLDEAKGGDKMEFSFEGTGIFGSRYAPKVIWFGVQPKEKLFLLSKDLNRKLEKIGYPCEHQNFVPHITVGRVREIADKKLFQEIIDKYKAVFLQKITVKEFYLFESILLKTGALYHPVKKYLL